MLFLLRLGVFIVMLVWTLDRFINPEHAARVFEHFYLLSNISPGVLKIVGGLELLIIFAFVAGYQKTMPVAVLTGVIEYRAGIVIVRGDGDYQLFAQPLL
jgi:hypothetical protein